MELFIMMKILLQKKITLFFLLLCCYVMLRPSDPAMRPELVERAISKRSAWAETKTFKHDQSLSQFW